jgi:hypothetical protein
MEVVPLLVLCSLCLAAGALLLFLNCVSRGDHEHADRLSLLPLEDDAGPSELKEPGSGGGCSPS